MHGSGAGIGGRATCPQSCPGFQVVDGIDDPPAKFAEHRAGAIAAMLFERACGKAEMDGGIGCFQVARRSCGDDMIQWVSPDMCRKEQRTGGQDRGEAWTKEWTMSGEGKSVPILCPINEQSVAA